MFATVLGPYPQIDGSPRERLMATIGDQLQAGLGMLSDGQVHGVPAVGAGSLVHAWHAADDVGHELAVIAGIEPPLIKVCLVGPWSAGDGQPRCVRAMAHRLVPTIRALFDAGVPVVQLTEPAVGDIGPDDGDAQGLLDEVLTTLTDGAGGHLSLALAGGRPTSIPFERLFAVPFASYLFDVIRSPDDWRLCARVPGSSGLIVGVADARTADPDTEAVSIWGARYAASLGGRGAHRVGLTTSAGLELLSRAAARVKLAALAEAGRKATLAHEDLARVIDPSTVDARSAALGRYEPRPRRR